jgi:hypothetical protein
LEKQINTELETLPNMADSSMKIRLAKTSDSKLFLIKLQQEDGKSYS